MIGILIVIVVACVAYWLVMALIHSFIVAVVAALLVLFAGVQYGGGGPRWGRRPL